VAFDDTAFFVVFGRLLDQGLELGHVGLF
jgi:hypothetical protein